MRRVSSLVILFACILVLFIGCGPSAQVIRLESRYSDTLMLGQVQQKTVGEPMIVREHLNYYFGFVALKEYTPPSILGTQYPIVRSGSEWSCSGKYEDGSYRCNAVSGWGYPKTLGRTQNIEYDLVITQEGNPKGVDVGNSGAYIFSDPQPVIFKPTKMVQPGSIRQELIYNGKSKDAIKISYREFNDNFARPAFSQDLSYDLADSKEIGFRGMVVEILDANNSQIKFIVRKPMNQ